MQVLCIQIRSTKVPICEKNAAKEATLFAIFAANVSKNNAK
jgi:hypothetical protein